MSLQITGCEWLRQWKMVIFDPPPYRIDTPQPITRILSQVITLATHTALPNLAHNGSWGDFWANDKYKQYFSYRPTPFENWPSGQTHGQIFAHDGSNDAYSRKDVPLRLRPRWLFLRKRVTFYFTYTPSTGTRIQTISHSLTSLRGWCLVFIFQKDSLCRMQDNLLKTGRPNET